jgi:hypothetical protein
VPGGYHQPQGQFSSANQGGTGAGQYNGLGVEKQKKPHITHDGEPVIGDLNKSPYSGRVDASIDKHTGSYPTQQTQVSRTDESLQTIKSDGKDKVLSAEQVEDDTSFSQAESSIKNGEAIASAQGRKNSGTAQTMVSVF